VSPRLDGTTLLGTGALETVGLATGGLYVLPSNPVRLSLAARLYAEVMSMTLRGRIEAGGLNGPAPRAPG
jgi:hypothetical protein